MSVLDINECTQQLANCPNSSECINNVGSYYCQCLPGYETPQCQGNIFDFLITRWIESYS